MFIHFLTLVGWSVTHSRHAATLTGLSSCPCEEGTFILATDNYGTANVRATSSFPLVGSWFVT